MVGSSARLPCTAKKRQDDSLPARRARPVSVKGNIGLDGASIGDLGSV